MNIEFWLRVLVDVVAFALIMWFLFFWYSRPHKAEDALNEIKFEATMTRDLTPTDMIRLAEIFFSTAVEMQEGLMRYESGGFLVSTAPNQAGGLHVVSNLILVPCNTGPVQTPFPASSLDADA